MALGHEDVSVGCNEDVVGLIERGRICRGSWLIAAGLAQSHEDLSIRTELEDLVSDHLCGGCSRRCCCRSATRRPWQVVLAVCDPDVSFPVHVNPMGKYHQSCSETFHQPAGLIELQYDIDVG